MAHIQHSESQTLVCIRITCELMKTDCWESHPPNLPSASDSVGLRWVPRFFFFSKKFLSDAVVVWFLT